MTQTFKTYDGVEVAKGAIVWFCYKNDKTRWGFKEIPSKYYADIGMNEINIFNFFSTREACQSYIDEMYKTRHLIHFSETYNIPINTVLEFIVNQKSNTLKELNEKKETN